ncbi:NAD(P)-dependent glyceraldehyde-3-phosphate dehydrogenase [Nanobdella aerobiophila]|uniref:NAD(P)-dependent glyceraldehyde-3-phosphate dehydrogenase n=1 Tax=Nanobdella aerobiophila TaxID=2586965 RepID=A0A915SL15_9ARCH|nr:aldehyde dehydrogenase family protein [Nanobdella aerobiophila]BBL45691.1 NAD(P)-dependent glyceraldehyde-3-phosphate dehydrogenase [Nanobdella aerobiophila]
MEINIKEKTRLDIKSEKIKEIIRYDENGIPIFPAFVNKSWYYGNNEYIEIRSPIDQNIIAKVPKVDYETVEKEIDRLYNDRFIIRDTPGYKRIEGFLKTIDLINENIEDFVNVLMINVGKTKSQAIGEINSTIERLKRINLDVKKIYGEYQPGDWSSDYLESEGIIKREPLGLILAISPFNYPLFDSVSKIISVLLAGNSLLLKPPSLDPLPVILYYRMMELSGLPTASFSLITVPGRDMNKITSNKKISGILFTGSTETGEEIIKNSGIKQYLMELGGGDPVFVLNDTDIDYTAQRIVNGVTSFSGQRCDSIKIILVESDIYDRFKNRLLEEVSKVKIGDPRDPDIDFGPIMEIKTVDELMKGIEDAKSNGGKIIYGGNRFNNYIEPTIIEIDKNNVEKLYLFNKEIFLAVSILVKIDNIEEAINIANKRRYGLDASIFGNDINKIRKIIRYIDVGSIYINDFPRHGIGYYPYGGRKDSGIGREGVSYSIEGTTTYKTVVYNYKNKKVWNYV